MAPPPLRWGDPDGYDSDTSVPLADPRPTRKRSKTRQQQSNRDLDIPVNTEMTTPAEPYPLVLEVPPMDLYIRNLDENQKAILLTGIVSNFRVF